MSSINPPDSPPASPVIPKGLATTLGQAGTLILGLASALTTILPGDHAGQTKAFATLATVVAVTTILGRMLQSAAALLGGNQPTPAAAVPVSDEDELPSVLPHSGDVPADQGDKGSA